MAEKKSKSGKATKKAKKASPGTKARAKAKAKPKAKAKAKAKPKAKAKAKAKPRAARSSGLDKSVEQFRESLEQSVTLSRDRLQEVVDDAVRRGRLQRSDAEKLLSDLVKKAAGRPTGC